METFFLFVLGSIVGSFLGALPYRIPLRISIAEGRSFCPKCKKQIRWFDNIPFISYILLHGKCRDCQEKISLREPLIELATAIVFMVLGLNIFNLIIASILIAIFVIDLEHQIIPDELVFSGLLIVNCKLIIVNSPMIFIDLLAGLLSALLLLSLHLFTKGRGMGLGDVKLALLLGAMAGLPGILVWLFFSFAVGAIVGIILILAGSAKMKTKIAFGPFLIIGFVFASLFAPAFIHLLGY